MKNITLQELENEKQKCISALKLSIDTFKKNTGILNANISLNGLQKGNDLKEICYSPDIRIQL